MSATESDTFGVVDDLPQSGTYTALEYLKDRMGQQQAAEVRRVKLRDTLSRPDLALTCRVPSNAAEIKQITKAAEAAEKAKDALPGGLILACMMLARFCEQVSIDGRKLAPGDGSAFAYPDLLETLHVSAAWLGVRVLFNDDFAVVRIWEQLALEAGIGASTVDVGEVEDPT